MVSRLRPACTSHVRTRNKADVPLRPSPRGQSSRRSSLNAARKPAEPFPRICQRPGSAKLTQESERLRGSDFQVPNGLIQSRREETRRESKGARDDPGARERRDGTAEWAYPVTVSPVTRARRPRPTTREGARMGAAWGARPRAVGPWHAMRGGACCCPPVFLEREGGPPTAGGVHARRAGPARQSSLL